MTERHRGSIANDPREIHGTLRNQSLSERERIAFALNRIEDLTHELENDAWGETREMDYVGET